jgi:hypothetical protein
MEQVFWTNRVRARVEYTHYLILLLELAKTLCEVIFLWGRGSSRESNPLLRPAESFEFTVGAGLARAAWAGASTAGFDGKSVGIWMADLSRLPRVALFELLEEAITKSGPPALRG